MEQKIEEKFEDVLNRVKDYDALDLAVPVANFAVHHCVAAVVVTIAHNLMPTTTRKEKIQLYIAARAVSGLVADKAAERISCKVKKGTEFAREIIRVIKNDDASKDDPTTAVPGSPETV